jgi:hypothetical protein
MRAALGQRHDPGLRKRCLLALAHPGPAEKLRVLDGVRYVQTGSVDGDHPTPSQP